MFDLFAGALMGYMLFGGDDDCCSDNCYYAPPPPPPPPMYLTDLKEKFMSKTKNKHVISIISNLIDAEINGDKAKFVNILFQEEKCLIAVHVLLHQLSRMYYGIRFSPNKGSGFAALKSAYMKIYDKVDGESDVWRRFNLLKTIKKIKEIARSRNMENKVNMYLKLYDNNAKVLFWAVMILEILSPKYSSEKAIENNKNYNENYKTRDVGVQHSDKTSRIISIEEIMDNGETNETASLINNDTVETILIEETNNNFSIQMNRVMKHILNNGSSKFNDDVKNYLLNIGLSEEREKEEIKNDDLIETIYYLLSCVSNLSIYNLGGLMFKKYHVLMRLYILNDISNNINADIILKMKMKRYMKDVYHNGIVRANKTDINNNLLFYTVLTMDFFSNGGYLKKQRKSSNYYHM